MEGVEENGNGEGKEVDKGRQTLFKKEKEGGGEGRGKKPSGTSFKLKPEIFVPRVVDTKSPWQSYKTVDNFQKKFFTFFLESCVVQCHASVLWGQPCILKSSNTCKIMACCSLCKLIKFFYSYTSQFLLFDETKTSIVRPRSEFLTRTINNFATRAGTRLKLNLDHSNPLIEAAKNLAPEKP